VENSKVKSERDSVKALIALVETLRGKHGCPWDKKQTPSTMLIYLIEEIYELADAIESDNSGAVREELGDVLFHIFFITRLFQENGEFSIYDVARDITEKMVRRHPHVFGNTRVGTTEEVRQNWHQIKQREKKSFKSGSVVDSVPKKMPALMRAYQLVERTARSGLAREDAKTLLHRVDAELEQLKRAMKHTEANRTSKEFGRLLFSLVNLAYDLKIHPETALTGAVKVFDERIRQMEKKVSEK